MSVTDQDRARIVDVLVAAAGDGVIDLETADRMLVEVYAAPDEPALQSVLARLPQAWTVEQERARQRRSAQEALVETASARFLELRTVWAGVSALCATIWVATGTGYPWPVWPALGVGIPVALQYRDLRRARDHVHLDPGGR